jgi:hypothetical protein
MTKTLLDSYIKKFSLGKIISKAKMKYTALAGTLHTRATCDNLSFMSDVVLKDFKEFGDTDQIICVGDTEKLRAIISPFTDEIKMSLNISGDRVLGMNFNDTDVETYFGSSDPVAIPPSPKNITGLDNPDVIISMTEEFVKQFLKAKVALDETASFAVAMNKKGLVEFVFGYLTFNSNKIRITPKTDSVKNKLSKGLLFPVVNLAEVLRANSDMIDGGKMEIFESGLIKLSFSNDQFEANYYQFSNQQ